MSELPKSVWATLNVSPIGSVLQGTLTLERSEVAAQAEYVLESRLAEVEAERDEAYARELVAADAAVGYLEERDRLAREVERLTALVKDAFCEGFDRALGFDPESEWSGSNEWPDSEAFTAINL